MNDFREVLNVVKSGDGWMATCSGESIALARASLWRAVMSSDGLSAATTI